VIAGLALWAAGWALCRAIVPGNDLLPDMAGFFTRAALLTFGGAYAVLPYVHQAAVEHYQCSPQHRCSTGSLLAKPRPGRSS
jgi:chromate transporter